MERTGPVDLQAIRERNVYDAGMEAGSTNARLDALDHRVGALDKKVGALDKKVDALDEKVDEEFKAVRREVKAGFDRLQWWLLGAALAIIVAFVGGPHL
jgi:outer membrane murein-binding lipoprotein Lpp